VWVAVCHPNQDSPQLPPRGFTGTLLAHYLSQHPAAHATMELNEVSILPFFIQIGAAKHVEPYDPKALANPSGKLVLALFGSEWL
jgi:hypothetical protein